MPVIIPPNSSGPISQDSFNFTEDKSGSLFVKVNGHTFSIQNLSVGTEHFVKDGVIQGKDQAALATREKVKAIVTELLKEKNIQATLLKAPSLQSHKFTVHSSAEEKIAYEGFDKSSENINKNLDVTYKGLYVRIQDLARGGGIMPAVLDAKSASAALPIPLATHQPHSQHTSLQLAPANSSQVSVGGSNQSGKAISNQKDKDHVEEDDDDGDNDNDAFADPMDIRSGSPSNVTTINLTPARPVASVLVDDKHSAALNAPIVTTGAVAKPPKSQPELLALKEQLMSKIEESLKNHQVEFNSKLARASTLIKEMSDPMTLDDIGKVEELGKIVSDLLELQGNPGVLYDVAKKLSDNPNWPKGIPNIPANTLSELKLLVDNDEKNQSIPYELEGTLLELQGKVKALQATQQSPATPAVSAASLAANKATVAKPTLSAPPKPVPTPPSTPPPPAASVNSSGGPAASTAPAAATNVAASQLLSKLNSDLQKKITLFNLQLIDIGKDVAKQQKKDVNVNSDLDNAYGRLALIRQDIIILDSMPKTINLSSQDKIIFDERMTTLDTHIKELNISLASLPGVYIKVNNASDTVGWIYSDFDDISKAIDHPEWIRSEDSVSNDDAGFFEL